MHSKLITGLVVFIIGLAILGFAVHSKQRVDNAKGNITGTQELFSPSPYSEAGGHMLQKQASSHDGEIRWLFIGGIVIACVGAFLMFSSRNKKRK